MRLIKRPKTLTYEEYSKQVYGRGKKDAAVKGKRQIPKRDVQARTYNPRDDRLTWDSPEALALLNEAIGTIASAKVNEELAKNDYRETKNLVLDTLCGKVQATKEELQAIVKVAEAKAKDNILNLDDSVSAVLRILDLDNNSVEGSHE